jgi:hypothetical protein
MNRTTETKIETLQTNVLMQLVTIILKNVYFAEGRFLVP